MTEGEPMKTEETILVTGFAQGPKGTTVYETYKTIGVVLVINTRTGVIEDAQFTVLTDLMDTYISSLIKGYDTTQGINPLLEKVKKHCLVPSQGAVVQAIRSAWDRYQESRLVRI
ncbi:DUF3870 domain-containing protein [Mesobacillus foraminis]|uniref:DUF3870 domain-containing protein n=1 Tax=Mesobacillus foraminis TaxID=279826 RepID=UPI00104960D4|nr:DUF3870 domain-containing protein [Mesobacillus foraminis]